MFDQLPEPFGKNFMIGFFMPMVMLILLNLLLAHQYDTLPAIALTESADRIDVLITTTILGSISYIGGVFLLAINRSVLRFMQGYGKLNPLKLWKGMASKRYRKLRKRLKELNEECEKCVEQDKEFPRDREVKLTRLTQKLAVEYPDEEDWLLPTRFGNVIRGFEIYSRVMYGLEEVSGWYRLLAVIPESYRSSIDSAKAHVDFWVNLIIVGFVILIEYVGLAVHHDKSLALWLPAGTICVVVFSYFMAIDSAKIWGEIVKASFDVFLPALREKLEFPFPKSLEEERKLWRQFSLATIFVRPEWMPWRSGKRLRRRES